MVNINAYTIEAHTLVQNVEVVVFANIKEEKIDAKTVVVKKFVIT